MVQFIRTETCTGVVFYMVSLVKVKHWHGSLVLVLKYCGDSHKTASEESHCSGLNILNAQSQEGRTSARIFMVHSNLKCFQTHNSYNNASDLKDRSL